MMNMSKESLSHSNLATHEFSISDLMLWYKSKESLSNSIAGVLNQKFKNWASDNVQK